MNEKRAVVMVAVWERKRKVLLVRKVEGGSSQLVGELALPGETLEFRETDSDAVHRGLGEEANIEVEGITHLAESVSYGMTKIGWYSCTVQNHDDASPGSDAEEVRWYKANDALSICLNLPSHPLPDAVKDFLRRVHR